MEYKLRRSDRAMTESGWLALLSAGEYGVLATAGRDGSPYGVPLSYVYMDGCVYFHCARTGRKLDCLRCDPRVCFTVVGSVRAVHDGSFTTRYSSAMVFGTASEVADEAERHTALLALCEKYLPAHIDKTHAEIEKHAPRTAVYRIDPEFITGKANKG